MNDTLEVRRESTLLSSVLTLADSPDIHALQAGCSRMVQSWIGVHVYGFHIFAGGNDECHHVSTQAGSAIGERIFDHILRDPALDRLFRTRSSMDSLGLMGRHCWSERQGFEYLGMPSVFEIVVGPLVIAGQVVGAVVIGSYATCVGSPVEVVFNDRDLNRFEAICGAASMALSRIRGVGGPQRSFRTWPALSVALEDETQDDPIEDRAELGEDRLQLSIADRALLLSLPTRAAMVAQLLCEGKTNKLIALELNLSPHTVRDHVQNLCRRLGCSTRTELIYRLVSGARQNQD